MAEQGAVVDERAAATAAFAEVATVDEALKVAAVEEAVSAVVTAAQGIEVRTAAEAETATEFLARLAGEKKQAEEARTFLVRPLNQHVKAINDRFRGPREELEQADGIVREKVLAYNAEQERLRAEEQARLDEERRRREEAAEEERRREAAAAQAAREAAAREAAAAEADRRRIEREAAEAAQRQRTALETRIAGMADEELERTKGADDERGPLARAELDRRRRAREAQEAADRAREAEEAARAAEEEARSRPLPEAPRAVVAPAGPLRSGASSASQRRVWKATAIDAARLPAEYLMPNEKAINEAIRQGVRSIPGVTIEHVAELSVRAR